MLNLYFHWKPSRIRKFLYNVFAFYSNIYKLRHLEFVACLVLSVASCFAFGKQFCYWHSMTSAVLASLAPHRQLCSSWSPTWSCQWQRPTLAACGYTKKKEKKTWSVPQLYNCPPIHASQVYTCMCVHTCYNYLSHIVRRRQSGCLSSAALSTEPLFALLRR